MVHFGVWYPLTIMLAAVIHSSSRDKGVNSMQVASVQLFELCTFAGRFVWITLTGPWQNFQLSLQKNDTKVICPRSYGPLPATDCAISLDRGRLFSQAEPAIVSES